MIENPVEPAPLRPPPVGSGLLGVAPRVDDEGDVRWPSGMAWLPEGYRVTGAGGYHQCSTDARDSDDVDVADKQLAQPFDVWAIDECSTVDSTRDRWGRAERALMADRSFWIAGELERGEIAQATGAPTAFLEDGDATDIALGSTNFEMVLVAMDDRLSRELRNRQGMVHGSPIHLAAAADLQLIRWNGSTPMTPNGHLFVADAGYKSGATAESTSVIYGTDMIRVWLGPVRFSPEKSDPAVAGMDVDANDVRVTAFEAVAYQWDRAAHLVATTDVGVPLPELTEGS